ncbi:MAG: SIMPL domain-containing protein [Anaerolineales bacterium]
MLNKKWILIVFTLGLVLSACQASPNAVGTEDQPRLISVQGTGQVSLDPTLARISVGVQTEDENAQEAVSANNQRVEEIMAVLGELGIPAEDMQTVDFSIRQQGDREPKQEIEGETQKTYVVSNIVRVTLRDLDQLGSLLDEVIQAGTNTIHGIQFDAENKEEANKNALELAMKDARARAEAIAGTADVQLGDVYRVETFGGGPVYAEREVAEEAAAAVPISPGQMDIEVRVNVSYQIEK